MRIRELRGIGADVALEASTASAAENAIHDRGRIRPSDGQHVSVNPQGPAVRLYLLVTGTPPATMTTWKRSAATDDGPPTRTTPGAGGCAHRTTMRCTVALTMRAAQMANRLDATRHFILVKPPRGTPRVL